MIDEAVSADIPRIRQIMTDYDDHEVDLADASLLAMCERLGISKIATLDVRHFSVYRTKRGRALEIVLK